MNRMPATLVALLGAALGAAPVGAQQPATDAATLLDKSQQAFLYAGGDMRARVRMELQAPSGAKRTRTLTMLRLNVAGGKDQKYFLYFHEPGDVRRTAFLVNKYSARDDDRWIFIPAVNMVRRVAARDSRSSFVGSDFSYEDVSGRDVEADDHTVLRREKLGEAQCVVIQSVPRAAADYSRKLAWIDEATSLPLKEEYYDVKNTLARVFTATKVTNVTGPASEAIPTVVGRRMENVASGHKTEVLFEEVQYGVGLPDSLFTEPSLETPPEKWLH